MGRLLFERRRNEGFWLGPVLPSSAAGRRGLALRSRRGAFGLLLLPAAVASLALGVVFGRCRFRCYEWG